MADSHPIGGKKFGLFFINKKGAEVSLPSAPSTVSAQSTIFSAKTQQGSSSEDELDEQASKVSASCLKICHPLI